MHTVAPTETAADARRLRYCFFVALAFAGLLWLIKLIELSLHLDLVPYGVYPRTLAGLRGILFAPLIHASLLHLFSNTLPILILGTALLYGYPRASKLVIPIVYFGSSIGVWLFARSAWHIGASGLTSGLLFFILTIGILRWDTRSIGLSLVVFLLYGGSVWGVVPGDPSVSFEAHLAGAILGFTLAILLRHYDPAPPEKPYSWEDAEANEGDAFDRDTHVDADEANK